MNEQSYPLQVWNIEEGPVMRVDHKTNPEWAWPGSRDPISKICKLSQETIVTIPPLQYTDEYNSAIETQTNKNIFTGNIQPSSL